MKSIYESLEDRETLEPLESDWAPAKAFFEERKAREPSPGSSSTWRGWSAELEASRADAAPTIHLPHILRILGPSSLTLYKHVLGRRRVLIITLPPVEAACILCHVAADTCFQEQVADAAASYDADGSEDDDIPQAMHGKSAGGIKVLGMITLNDLDKLEFESKSGRGWIACTTDAIFLDKPSYYDLVIDLRSATPNTRPAFFVSKPVEPPSGRGPSFRLSSVRFTWSDVRLVSPSPPRLSNALSHYTARAQWTELDRVLQLDSADNPDDCCDPSHHTHHSGQPRNSTSSSWTDVWRVYEDVCVMCAGLWMGAWRSTSPITAAPPPYGGRRSQSWNSVRLDGDDERERAMPLADANVRTLGAGIEGGRPSAGGTVSGRTSRALKRVSTLSAFAWPNSSSGSGAGSKGDARIAVAEAPAPTDAMFIPGDRSALPPPPPGGGARDGARQVATTLALLAAFRAHTTAVLARFAVLLEARRFQQLPDASGVGVGAGGSAGAGGGRQQAAVVCFSPKDVMSFELGPFSGLDARFVEWLGEEYGGGTRVLVRRGWKDLVGLVLGFG